MKYLSSLLLLFVLSFSEGLFAQCGGSEVCNGNAGLYSNDDAADIAYDNMGTSFHSSYIKEPNGEWRVWGQNMNNNGQAQLSPLSINQTNHPALTGTIYKVAMGSYG